MKLRIQVLIESDNGQDAAVHDLKTLERGPLASDNLGLTLAEAKQFLEGVQRSMVSAQVTEEVQKQRCCVRCGNALKCKGTHEIVFRTLFGKLSLDSPRLRTCGCETTPARRFSPLAKLLPERRSPELVYLETKFASLMPYGVAVNLLGELLPIGASVNAASTYRQVQRVAQRIEDELGDEQASFIEGCPRDWEGLPDPGPPLTVGIDGGYVHAKDQKSRAEGWFEVIVGKSVLTEGGAKYFAFVNNYDIKPRRRLFELLKSQGLQMNQPITFLSDGGETVRDLPRFLCPDSEHWLDWFHITMRLTVMSQMTKSLAGVLAPEPESKPTTPAIGAETMIQKVKWHLWHGNVPRALQRAEDLEGIVESEAEPSESRTKLLKAIREFQGYISANRRSIPNFGDRYRHGETITTAFVESSVNCIVSKRFVKKQQMRWTQRGAHLLLQLRTREINGELRGFFERWHPSMNQ